MTFLFTDIEGSTRLLDLLGDRYAGVLARHRHLIVDACTRHGGVPVNTEGDALFIAFAGASDAVAAVVAAQRSLASESWPEEGAVLVRMGLHTGEADVVDDDYVGMAVHIAARVASAGHGGQVLVTDVTHRLANEPPAIALGAHRLKDVGEHRLLQLVVDDAPTEFPPLRTLTALPNNLPSAVDAFVGRQLELSELVSAIEAHRLVTLTGPGGSGKTRLAIETAATMLPAFEDGVWLVSLATVADGGGVLPEIAATLRVAQRLTESLDDALDGWLRDRSVLLLLDNCEHVVDAVTRFCDRHLPAAPGMRVLATSREFLGVRGEHAIRTPPLAIPDDPSLAAASDAVELFLARAEACAPRLGAAADLDLVVQVCRRLDGLPLAIELAASRLRALSLEQLASRLDDRFRLLTGGSRSDLPRHRTLEAVVSWSYELLSDAERLLFARLGVFPHHFSLEMVEDVCDGEPLDRVDVVDLLSRLVEKSLVTTVAVEDGLRYQLLETLRHYAVDRLVDLDEADRWRARMLEWSVGVADRIERVLRTPAMDRALRQATVDAATHRAAMTWAAERGRAVDALRIASAVPVAAVAERLPLLQAYVIGAAGADDRTLGFAHAAIGNLAFERSDWDLSARANSSAVTHFERAGLRRHATWAQYLQMHSTWGAGDLATVDAL
ncbi:MAG: hypothetical protein QOD30_2241, partial [Actinomycetota bacterium]|nr:hypothetical protein [Actinomycetota bacterium]